MGSRSTTQPHFPGSAGTRDSERAAGDGALISLEKMRFQGDAEIAGAGLKHELGNELLAVGGKNEGGGENQRGAKERPGAGEGIDLEEVTDHPHFSGDDADMSRDGIVAEA